MKPTMIKNLITRLTTHIKSQRIKRRSLRSGIVYSTIFFSFAAPVLWYFTCSKDGEDRLQQLISNSIRELVNIKIPYFMRAFFYSWYAKKYDVNLQQIDQDIRQYSTFSKFFTRTIKKRPHLKQTLKDSNTVCSPCDGQILNISKIQTDQNMIIKNIKYSISKLLFQKQDPLLPQQLKFNPDNELYQIIIYLNPGNYHRFHSPYKLNVKINREINGKLKPVNIQSLVKYGGIVYQQNARKIVHGYYLHPNYEKMYLGLAMVGARNVGDIFVKGKTVFEKGEEIGYFNLGSTIVMLVEMKPGCKIQKNVGDKVQFGQPLYSLQ